MTDFISPEAEQANLQAIASELATKPQLEQWAVANSDIATHVGDIHKLYPWLTPGVTLALGTARYNADDPFVKHIADQVLAAGRKADPGYNPGRPLELAAPNFQNAVRGESQQIIGQSGIPGADQGTGSDPLGAALGAVGHVVHGAMTELGSMIPTPTRSYIKTDVRWAFAGAQAGLESVSAAYRGISAASRPDPWHSGEGHNSWLDRLTGNNISTAPTSLTPQLTIAQMINGQNAGSGFFPSGAAAKASHTAQLSAASEGGHALTIGRGIAGTILPANTKAYGLVSGLADAAVAFNMDPALQALEGVGVFRAAQKGVAEAGTHWGEAGGIIDQARQAIGIRTATEQLNSRVGQAIIQKLADLHDYRSVDHFLGGKPDAWLMAQLTHADTPEAVRAILDTQLGTGIETLPAFHPKLQALTTRAGAVDDWGNPLDKGLGNLGYTVDRTIRDWRPMAQLPGGVIHVDLSNAWARNENVRTAEAFLLNARVDGGNISPIMEKFATATNRNQLYDATKEMLNTIADHLTREFNVDPAKAREMTRAYTGLDAEGRQTAEYFLHSLTDKMVVPGQMVDGKPMIFDGPHLPSEMLQNQIKLPDFREIRRAASTYRKFVSASLAGGDSLLKAQDFATAGLDAAMHLWKGAQLIRPALMVRILGESQLAMAAGGDASLFRHPLDWISYVVGHKGAVDVSDAEHAFSALDYNRVMKVGQGAVLGYDPERVWTSQWTQIARGQNGFHSSWAQEVRHLHLDQLSRETAQAMIGGNEVGARTVDELKQAFFDGHLRQIRVDMIEPNGGWRNVLDQRAVSDRYIDSVVLRVRTMTQDDPELLKAIATGDFRGEPLAVVKDGKQLIGRARYAAPPASVADRLRELDASGNSPEHVKGFLFGSTKIGNGAMIAAKRDQLMGKAFSMLVGSPIDHLAASPHFRQAYFSEIDKLLPYMDPAEAAKVVARAEKAGIGGLDASRAAGSLGANEVDTLAKSRSLDSMKAMLHDLSHRSQASDMLRFVAPFGDAWKKVITRWAKLISENPATLERFRQGMHEGTQSGFVHTDEYGKQVFTIPFTAGIDKALTGLPFPQTAPLNGLSIVGSGLPGVGPALTVPLGLIAPHVPVLQDILTKIAPYGVPNVKQGMVEAFFPGWLQRFRTASGFASPQQQSTYNHTVAEVLRYGISTGKYKYDTPTDMAQALADARQKAKDLYMVRGFMQFISPSPPSVQTMVKDKSGRLTASYVLANELQNLYAGKGVDGKGHNDATQAAQIFLRLHGDQNYAMLQNFTTPRRYGLPSTVGGAAFVASHPGFKRDYPNVYGLLVPQKGAFDYSLYQSQIGGGERVDRTPEEFWALARARVAAMIYDNERNKLPDDASAADKSGYLAQLRAWLVQKYPGYQDQTLDQSKASLPMAIAEIGKAAADPAVKNSDAAKGVVAYMALRQQVIDWEKQNGYSGNTNALSTSADFAPQNAWLSQQASALISKYPTFFPAWDNLFSHEIHTPALQPTPVGG